MYCLNLMRIALELAQHNPVYEDIATKFFEHFLHIAEAMTNIGGNEHGIGLWDEEDEFYYDELNLPDGRTIKLKVRSMVGLIPLFAVETLEPELLEKLPDFTRRLHWFLKHRPDLAELVSRWDEPGRGERRLLSLLARPPHEDSCSGGCSTRRSSSPTTACAPSPRYHERSPTPFRCRRHGPHGALRARRVGLGAVRRQLELARADLVPGQLPDHRVAAEVPPLLRRRLQGRVPHRLAAKFLTIGQVAEELSRRLTRIFLRDESGRRPVLAYHDKLHSDPHFRDYVLFHEYFHGDTGRGVGASHQTGWTGLVAKLLQPRRTEPRELCGAKQAEEDEVPAGSQLAAPGISGS